MRTFATAVTAELSKEILQIFILCKMEFTTELNYSTLDIPTYYGGKKYIPINFEVESVNFASSLSVDSFTLKFDNTDLGMSATVLGEDVRGSVVTLYAGIHFKNGTFAYEEIFRGMVDQWTIDGDATVSFRLVNEFILWNKKVLRTHASGCQWTFKGTECAYAGANSVCDHTYESCDGNSNTDNYGGFRWLPSIVEKDIWWGRVPS